LAACRVKRRTAHDGPARKTRKRPALCGAHFAASGSGDEDGAMLFWCSDHHLQLQVVIPALTRT
jgi:hypothetical protein